MSILLSGNEAIALGFLHSNGSFASGYPGTPSTEIIESLLQYKKIYCEWAPNEKVAVESCIGASYAGLRSIATMKHVGVNVAADPIFTLSYTGCNAGLVIITADDPGIHSSQNEQDNRWYAKAAKIPMFEPSDSQECYDFVKLALSLSEKFRSPVFIRLTTRISHCKSLVKTDDTDNFKINPLSIEKSDRFNPIPEISKKLHYDLENKLNEISLFNHYHLTEEGNDKKIGIITSGISYQYVKEIFGSTFPILKLNLIYPLNMKTILDFSNSVEKLYIIEELDGFLEAEIKNYGIKCIGKDLIPNVFELSPEIIKKSLNSQNNVLIDTKAETKTNKCLSFCSGCPYRAFFFVLSKYKDVIISSDIGCYSLSCYEPFYTKDIAICMGAGFSIAHGIEKSFEIIGSNKKCIGIMGDSTFFHSGIQSLITSVYNQSNTFLIILDNSSTSMTGLQNNPGTGKNLNNGNTVKINIVDVVTALGVKNVKVLNTTSLDDIKKAIDWGIDVKTTSVLIYQNKCKLKELKESKEKHYNAIDTNTCTRCKNCLKIGCPSIICDNKTNLLAIDPLSCTGCNLCIQLCKNNAIRRVKND